MDFPNRFTVSPPLDNCLPTLLPVIYASPCVSFDVFDTCIFRNCVHPGDVDMLTESGRMKYTSIADEEECKNHRNTKIHNDHLKALFDTEVRLHTRNEEMYEVYNLCRRLGKRIIFISDMHFSSETVKFFLNRLGFDGEVFSSADAGTTKTGNLFDKVAQRIGVQPDHIIHIDNDYHCSMSARRKSLMSYVYYRNEVDSADLYKGIYDKMPRKVKVDMARVFGILLNSRHRYANHLEELGYMYFGPTVLYALLLLHKYTMTVKPDNLYFLLRDTDLLSTLYKEHINVFPSYRAFVGRTIWTHIDPKAAHPIYALFAVLCAILYSDIPCPVSYTDVQMIKETISKAHQISDEDKTRKTNEIRTKYSGFFQENTRVLRSRLSVILSKVTSHSLSIDGSAAGSARYRIGEITGIVPAFMAMFHSHCHCWDRDVRNRNATTVSDTTLPSHKRIVPWELSEMYMHGLVNNIVYIDKTYNYIHSDYYPDKTTRHVWQQMFDVLPHINNGISKFVTDYIGCFGYNHFISSESVHECLEKTRWEREVPFQKIIHNLLFHGDAMESCYLHR